MYGAGLGLFIAPNNSATLGAAPAEHAGQAGGLLNLMRAFGTATGIAVANSCTSSSAKLCRAARAAAAKADVSFLGPRQGLPAFMTGNIAFLGMGIAGDISAPSLVAVLTSMAGFAIGVCLATRMVTFSCQSATCDGEPPTRIVWPQCTTFALGVSLLAHLCFVVTWLAIGGRPGEGDTLVLLAAWALAMGIQSVAAYHGSVW